jgi:Carboxypeptidase regulatory-like domain
VEGGELDLSTLHLSTFPVEMNSMGSGFANTSPKADGAFTFEGASPENVRIGLTGLKPNAFVKAIRVADREVTDEVDLGAAANGLEIVVSLNGGAIEGVVKSSGPKPPSGATVVLAPDDEHASLESWYHSTATDQDGHYKLESVRPGKYTLYAFEDLEPGAYMEPGFLKRFSKYALDVDLAEKAHLSLQPDLIPATVMDDAR